MKNRKSPRQKAAAHGKGLKKAGGLRKGKTTSHPRWLAPRPYFAPAFLASPIASSGGSSGVNVTMVGRDLGIDKQGYRQQSQDAPSAGDNRYSWIHQAPQRDLTLPHDTTDDAGNPIPDDEEWPNYWTMMVKVTPADRADQITFEKHGDEPWCVEKVVASTDTSKGEIRVRITAKVPTTAITKHGKKVRRPTGTLIVAKYKGVKVAQANFYVIRPEFFPRKPTVIFPVHPGDSDLTPPRSLTMHAPYEGQAVASDAREGQAPPEKIFWNNVYYQWNIMPVQDQYMQPLADFYAGTAVFEEGDESEGWIAWSSGATYLDPVWRVFGNYRWWRDIWGHYHREYDGLLPEFPLPWIDDEAGDFVVRVAGWVLNNGDLMNRRISIRDVTPPSPYYPHTMPLHLHYTLEYF